MDRLPVRQNEHRRSNSRQYKAELVAQALSGHTSIAALAMEHGLNSNLLHRWGTEHRRYGKHELTEAREVKPVMAPANWIPLPQGSSTTKHDASLCSTLKVELCAVSVKLTLHWPMGERWMAWPSLCVNWHDPH